MLAQTRRARHSCSLKICVREAKRFQLFSGRCLAGEALARAQSPALGVSGDNGMHIGRRTAVALAIGLTTFASGSFVALKAQAPTDHPTRAVRQVEGRAAVRPAAARTAAIAKPDAGIVARERELLDQYCVTCHNDRSKTANLSLQNLDLTAVGDQAELWERVVRKLRAGVMPPPAIKRPALE